MLVEVLRSDESRVDGGRACGVKGRDCFGKDRPSYQQGFFHFSLRRATVREQLMDRWVCSHY